MTAPTAPVPGFYADPLDAGRERWWDGAAWTEDVRALPVAAPAPEPVADAAAALEVPRLADDPFPPAAAVAPAAVAPAAVAPAAVAPAAVAAVTEPLLAAEPAAAPAAMPAAVPPGLYPDPYGQAPLRWWDGQQWTTRTSQPSGEIPHQPPTGGSTILPGGSTILPGGPAGHPTATSAPGHRTPRRTAQDQLVERLSSALDSLRVADRRVLAGVLVLVLAVVAGGGWWFLGRGPSMPAPTAVAAAVNLRATDLPTGWKVEPADASSSDPAGDALQRDLDRCLGAPDRASAEVFSAESPTWARGTGEIGSEVAVLRSRSLVQQDLQAQRNPAVASCIGRVATPALRKNLAAEGVQLLGLSASRLPNAPADGFALRLKMTLVANGRTVVMWNDSYGFVRGTVEVALNQSSAGAAPDRALATRALAQLRIRASAEIPSA